MSPNIRSPDKAPNKLRKTSDTQHTDPSSDVLNKKEDTSSLNLSSEEEDDKRNLLYPNFSKTALSLAPPKTISSNSFKKSCTHRSVLWLTPKCLVTPLTFLNSSRPSRSLNRSCRTKEPKIDSQDSSRNSTSPLLDQVN